jgi:hypothetical protein
MAIFKSDYATGAKQMPDVAGAAVVAVRMPVSIAAAQADNDMIEFGFLPEDCAVVDWFIDTADLDSGTPELIIDVGIINAAGDGISTETADGGDEWADGVTIGQSAGITRATTIAAVRTVPSASRRKVGAKIMTNAATGVLGVMAMTLFYRAADHGV